MDYENNYLFNGDNIANLIVEQLYNSQDKIAVIDETQSFTYKEIMEIAFYNICKIEDLNSSSDYILVATDCGVFLPLAWITCLLMDKIFVPIDINWPNDRLNFVRDVTKAQIVLSNHNQSSKLTEVYGGIKHFNIYTLSLNHNSHYIYNMKPKINRIMYGFFTSGSTGKPKCCLNHHYGVLNRLQYMSECFGLDNVVFQNSSHLFDSSIWQLLWPLISGGTIVISKERKSLDILSILNIIHTNRVTITDFVPSIFNLLVRYIQVNPENSYKLEYLKNIIIGGETADINYIAIFQSLFPHINIINTYGHTEASIGMIMGKISINPISIPLGKPIPNTFTKICDNNLKEVEPEVIGQIIVGGICVGSGYLNEEFLNKKRFIKNPFDEEKGNLVFLTGDFGYMDELGDIYYVGREDYEVKINGILVNLVEIENIIKQHFKGIEVFALKVEHPSIGSYIGLLYKTSDNISDKDIVHILSIKFPKSHLPSRIVKLSQVPLNQNGKADKQRMQEILIENKIDISDSSSEIQKICTIFQKYTSILITSDADLRKLNLDSISIANLVIDIEETLSCRFDIDSLYKCNTPNDILQLAKYDNTIKENNIYINIKDILNEFNFPTNKDDIFENVLLTGATGYFGIFILKELLYKSFCEVNLLIRAKSIELAYEKLLNRALKANLNLQNFITRINIVLGDLSESNLGLDQEELNSLAQSIDLIIHAGAKVHFMSDYTSLSDTNVRSTIDLIKICSTGKPKKFCYISSYSVKNASNYVDIDFYGNLLINNARDGYGLSNLVSEHLVIGATRLGLNANVIRIDDILPSIETREFNQKSLIYLFFKTCIDLKLAPQDIGGIPATIADEISSRVFHYTFDSSVDNNVLEVSSSKMFDIYKLFLEIDKNYHIGFKFVKYEIFYESLILNNLPLVKVLLTLLPKPQKKNLLFSSQALDKKNVMRYGYNFIAETIVSPSFLKPINS